MRFLYVLILLMTTQVAQAQPAINSLDELLDYADKNSPAARQALLQPQLARQDKQTQASVLYPRVNAFATGDYYPILATQLIPAEALGGAPGTYLKAQFGLPYVFTTGAELTVPVVNLENWAKLAKAKAQYEQSEWSSKSALENLHLQLVQAYYQALVTGEVLELNVENESTADEMLRIMAARNEQGVVEPADYNRSKNLSLDVKTSRIGYTQALQKSINNLESLLAVDTVILKEQLDDFAWPALYDGASVVNRPAWKEAEWKVRTAELSLRQGRTGGLPELMLTSRYTYNMQTNFEPGFKNIDFNVANVGLRLNVPLFQGNYYRAAKHKNKLQLEQARLEQERTEAALTQQQQDWLSQYHAAYSKHKVLQDKLATAKENLRIAQLNTKEGVMEFDQFNNIFMDYNRARMEYIQNLADGILYHLLSTQNF